MSLFKAVQVESAVDKDEKNQENSEIWPGFGGGDNSGEEDNNNHPEEKKDKLQEKSNKNLELHEENAKNNADVHQRSTLLVKNQEYVEENRKSFENAAEMSENFSSAHQSKNSNNENFRKNAIERVENPNQNPEKNEESKINIKSFSVDNVGNESSKKNELLISSNTQSQSKYGNNFLRPEMDQNNGSVVFSQVSKESQKFEQIQAPNLIFTALTKEKAAVLIDSPELFQVFLDSQPFSADLKQLSLTFSQESFEKSNPSHALSVKLCSLLQQLNSLISLKISLESPLFEDFPIEFSKLFAEVSKKTHLSSLKISIKTSNSLKISSEEVKSLLSQKDLRVLKLDISAKFPVLLKINAEIDLPNLETLILKGCVLNLGDFSLKIPNLKEFSSVIPVETHCRACFLEIFKENAHNTLSKLELFVEEGGPCAKLVETVKKLRNLERISLVFLNNSKNNAFSNAFLHDLLENLLFSEGEFEQLLEISLEIHEFFINENEVLELLQGKNLNICAKKLKKLLLNSTDFYEYCMNSEFLDAKASELHSKELTENLRPLLRSKTMLNFMEKQINCLSLLAKTLQIPDENALMQQIQEFIMIYDETFSDLEHESQAKQSVFSIDLENKAKIWFVVRTLDLFFELDGKNSLLCINFKQKAKVPEKNAEESPLNTVKEKCNFLLNLEFEANSNLDFSIVLEQLTFANLEKLLLLFENSLEIPLIFFEVFGKNAGFANLRSFMLSIHMNSEQECAISPRNKHKTLIFPKKIAEFRLVNLLFHLSLPKSHCKQSIFSDFCAVLSLLSSQKSLINLDFSSQSLGNEDIYQQFLPFMQAIAENHETLLAFALDLRYFPLANAKLHRNTLTAAHERLKTLRKLQEINIVLRETALGNEFIDFLIEFLLNCKQEVQSLSLDLRKNKLLDVELENLWRSLRNFPNLKELRLYLHENKLKFATFALLHEEIKSFPEELTYLKLDFEKNPLDKGEAVAQREELLVKVVKNLSIRLKKLKDLQFHLNRCKLGKRELLSFLKEVANLQVPKIFCDLSGNQGFWEAPDWSAHDFQEIKQIFLGFQAKDAKISLKPAKKFKVDAELQRMLRSLCEELKKSQKNALKLIV